MAGLIDVGILKPELAGSFAAGYRGAEQARQQSQQQQQQFEMNQMKLEQLKQDRAALTDLQSKLRAAGQSDDPRVFFRTLIQTGNPDYMNKGYEGLQRYQALMDYEREYGVPSSGATMPAATPAANALAAPVGEPVAAPITPSTGTVREIAPGGAAGPEMPLTRGGPAPANALAPAAAAAPATNAMLASAAGAAPDVNALMRRYNLASKAGSPDAAVILKQVEAALRGDQTKPITVSRGQVVIDPRTGQQIFSAPETITLSDRFVPVGRLVFDRQTQQYISPTQAQLAQSQERAPAAAAQKAPAGYRFTPSGDLEPIPGGPAAKKEDLTPAQQVKRRDTLGKEFKSAQAALQTTQDVLDSIAFVKSEPGLSRATGFTGLLPSFSEGAAASAETRLANLKGKITALGKAAAASTGAIGSIANQEWKILSDQIAAIDPVKGKGPLLDQLALVEAQAQGAMARIQDAYQRQFGEDFERFPQFSTLPAPKSSFTPKTPAAGAVGGAATGTAPAAAQGTGGFRYLGKEGK